MGGLIIAVDSKWLFIEPGLVSLPCLVIWMLDGRQAIHLWLSARAPGH